MLIYPYGIYDVNFLKASCTLKVEFCYISLLLKTDNAKTYPHFLPIL